MADGDAINFESMAALTGDDEIELLLSQMGGGAASPAAVSTTTTTASEGATEKKEKERPHKRRKKKRKRDVSNVVNEDSTTSFADTRLTQNPFEWPCCHKNGDRRLVLGSGLAHDCKGYTCDKEAKYGSNSCMSCGKSAATHELLISSSETSKDDADDPFSAISIALMIASSRNARCLMAEYYPNESKKQTKHLLPPINSISSSSKLIMNKLDSHAGKVLARAKKMENKTSPNISRSDVDLLREKVSDLVKTTMAYKEAFKTVSSSNTNAKAAGVALIESRLAAVAACDEVYYRCYYACFFFASDNQVDLTSLVPHPPTYLTCPGLAWDAKESGVASLEVFLGEMKHDEHSSSSLAAPLDDATRQLLLSSWCLQERLSSAETVKQYNPLLSLWQSRFLESIRHICTTNYTFVKSPIALKAALNMKHCDDHSDPLIRHETYGLSPASETWRGSVRDYPANFYAYAVPTPKALEAILEAVHNQGSIVEAGAGTGYLSALLATHLKKDRPGTVFPYDSTPPRQANAGAEVASNEYHGQVPTFIDVHQAQSFEQAQSMVSNVTNASLLLCYPPPASEMAAVALSQYIANGGETVIHVGEWQGLTGNKTFESMLHRNFYCEEKDIIPLPMWGTDTTYLTIWKKKSYADSKVTLPFSPAIGYCSANECSNLARRRCRFARCLQYCNAECFQRHATTRRAILALHMIHLSTSNEMDFENVNHFVPLTWVAHHHDEGRSQKKRKKKKHHK